MKLILKKDNNDIPEITIKYKILDSNLKLVIETVKGLNKKVVGIDMDKKTDIILNIQDIYYIETVDRKTFINLKKQVFEINKKLYELLDDLKYFGFCQINKSCILNIKKLDKVEKIANSRLKGYLNNGEKIIITRTYITTLKSKLKGE